MERQRSLITPVGGDGQQRVLLLLLPGLGGNTAQWDAVLPILAGTTTVDVAYGAPIRPHPAFAGAVPTVGQLASAMAAELARGSHATVVVVSHSVGAFVALEIARHSPSVVKRVVLVNGGLTSVAKFLDHPGRELLDRPGTCLSALHLFALVGAPAPDALKRAIASSATLSRLVLGNLVSPAALESHDQRASLIEKSSQDHVVSALWHNRHHWSDFRRHAGQITSDVVFVTGEQDPLAGEDDTMSMAAMMPHTTVQVLRGIGHATPLEDPAAVADAIRDAINAA